jgi:colanic acid/amylovoran biosynthesis glycosyltransferase
LATEAGQRIGVSTTESAPARGLIAPWWRAGDSTARIAYFVSRFPVTTETFIVRELDEIAHRPDVEAEIYSLFPAPPGAVHRLCDRWLERVHRSGPSKALRGLAWCLMRHPLRTTTAAAQIVWDHRRRPALIGRCLIAFAAAAAHVPAVRRARTTHVHAHFATYPAMAAWLCHRLLGIPFSFTVHAHDIYVHQLGLRRRIDEAEFVVAISQYNRRLVEQLGRGSTPVHVIHCGVDVTDYDYEPRTPPLDGEVRALCVASLEEKKGHRFLFAALASGIPGLERIHLDLIGSGKLTEELEAFAWRLGIAGRVRFLGSRPEHEVAQALREADLFVLPSVLDGNGDMEGIPVALMEAMASGVPVISSRLSGIPELVRDGETGLLAEPCDVEGIARAIARTIDDPDETGLRVEAARDLVERDFELRKNSARLARLLGVSAGRLGTATSGVRIGRDAADQAQDAPALAARLSRGW